MYNIKKRFPKNEPTKTYYFRVIKERQALHSLPLSCSVRIVTLSYHERKVMRNDK